MVPSPLCCILMLLIINIFGPWVLVVLFASIAFFEPVSNTFVRLWPQLILNTAMQLPVLLEIEV